MTLRAALLCVGLFGLAACDAPTATPEANAVAAAVGDIGPGSAQIDVDTALQAFDTVCVKTFPTYVAAPKTLQAMAFSPNPATGTYYDNRRDVSFKIKTGGKPSCSMVFTSRAKALEFAIGFGLMVQGIADRPAGTAKLSVDPSKTVSLVKLKSGQIMRFAPGVKSAGKQYYRAVIAAE